MAFLTEITPRLATPSIRENPKDGDIVINGVAYDKASMMPKVGKNEVFFFDTNSSIAAIAQLVDDNDAVAKMTPGLGNNFERVTAISLSPSVKRQMEDDRTRIADTWIEAASFRYDFHGRDWQEHPAKIHYYDDTNDMYYCAFFYSHRYGQWNTFRGTSNEAYGINWSYYSAPTYLNIGCIWDVNDYGVVGTGHQATTAANNQGIYGRNYSADALLETATVTTIYQESAGNTNANVHYMGKMDNGDLLFAHDRAFGNKKVGRVLNATNAISWDVAGFGTANAMKSMPSNVVRHNETSETNTNKKIFYWSDANNTTAWNSNDIYRFEIDTAQGTVTSQTCIKSNGSGVNNLTDNYGLWGGTTTAYFNTVYDSRICSTSTALNSQKFLMTFVQQMGDDNSAGNNVVQNQALLCYEISASDDRTLTCRQATTWSDLLTTSSRNNNIGDKMPWCVAPLNAEHTLCMVFCTFSTHLIKLDTTIGTGGGTWSEIWMDDELIFTDVAWLPQGKILASHWDERKRHGTPPGIIGDSYFALQVFSEDMIYKLDITPSLGYAEYSGSNISASVTINAYDANEARVATQVRLEIQGPAVWDNSTVYKDVTLSSSADTTENITITGDGQIEFKVVEIQSI